MINNSIKIDISPWKTDKFIIIVLAIQLAMLGMLTLEIIGIKILFFRSFIGFIYLTFLPGAIILRILRLRDLDITEYLLYLIGLSLSSLMFLGFTINLLGQLFSIAKPLSMLSLFIIFNILLVLSLLYFYIFKNSENTNTICSVIKINLYELLLMLLPFLIIFASYLNNYYSNNTFLLISIVFLSLIPLVSIWNPENEMNYCYQIFIISFSLLLQGSLSSPYIFGSDLSLEYYFSNLVVINNIWNSTISNQLNAMLSLVMLAPIYSFFLDLDLTWIFKLLYPFFFSLVPVGLFKIYERQTNSLIAFISIFFFVSLFTFYTEMLSLARQQIAELYLVILLLLVLDNSINKTKRSLLIILFSFALVVSHYSLSYIYIFIFIAVIIMQKFLLQLNSKNFYKKKIPESISYLVVKNFIDEKLLISSNFALLFAVSALAWYIFVSGSSIISSITHIGLHIATSIQTEFLEVNSSDGLTLLLKEMNSLSRNILRYLHLISQGLIILGLLTTLMHFDKSKFKSLYVFFSFLSLLICLFALFVPHFGNSLNTTRLYHISLFFLSPYFIVGWRTIFGFGKKVFKYKLIKNENLVCLRTLAIFLSIYLLFNIGFVEELSQDNPSSVSLSKNSIINYGSLKEKAFYSSVIHTYEQDVYGARWLSNFSDNDSYYYSDFISKYCLISYGMIDQYQIKLIDNATSELEINSYLRLGYSNIFHGVSLYRTPSRQSISISTEELEVLKYRKNKTYNSGFNIVYYV